MARARTIFTASFIALGTAPGLAVLATSATAAGPSPQNSVSETTICHATGSDAHPFNAVIVDASSILLEGQRFLGGHGDHADDIIPSISVDGASFPGQNFTGTFADIWANGCEPLPSPSPTPTVTASVTPTPTGSSTATPTPTPTVTASVTATPTPTPTATASVTPTPTSTASSTPTPVVTSSTPPSGGVLVAAGPVASASPSVEASIIPPLGATVPEDAFDEMELAEEGAFEPLAATIPEAVPAGGGSLAGSGDIPLPAVLLIAASAVTAAAASVSLRRW